MIDNDRWLALQAENAAISRRVVELEAELSHVGKQRAASAVPIESIELEHIVDSLSCSCFRLDSSGVVLASFIGSASLIQYAPEECRGKQVGEVLPRYAKVAALLAFEHAASFGETVTVECSFPFKQGEECLEGRVSPAGHGVFILVLQRTTPGRHVRQALREANAELETRLRESRVELSATKVALQQFQALMDQMPDAIALVRQNGMVTYSNPAGRDVFGLKEDESVQFLDIGAHIVEASFRSLGLMNADEGGAVRDVGVLKRQDGSRFHGHLTAFVIERTAADPLLQALIVRDVSAQVAAEAERQSLQEQVIEAQRAALRQLSTPLMPIARSVLAMPLIGNVSRERAEQILETLLRGIKAHAASVVLLDITGVPTMDEHATNALVRTATAVALLGAKLVLTGMRSEVAQMVVGIQADLQGIVMLATLEQGIAFALKMTSEKARARRA